uniref:Uncharacterized protein n=1 Tax=Haptolina brevifila TaxID=156173 RepID=A0A7S2CLT6_9EUKA
MPPASLSAVAEVATATVAADNLKALASSVTWSMSVAAGSWPQRSATDKITVTAKGLMDFNATSWNLELHDRSWPASKTLKYQINKVSLEASWKSQVLTLRPGTSGRVLAWRAMATAKDRTVPWTAWQVFDCDKERQKAAQKPVDAWAKVFEPEPAAPAAAAGG